MVDRDAFATFVRDTEPSLRRALVAAYGPERGREATAEAFAWAWAHTDRLSTLSNPVAYLYRVGQSRSRRLFRRPAAFPPQPVRAEPWVEPQLAPALAALTEHQRVAVVLVHGFEWTLREVAELLGVEVTTVQNHLERGLAKLRAHLEVEDDVTPR